MSDEFVLGINVSHDISCAIVKNGVLVCAIAEERLNPTTQVIANCHLQPILFPFFFGVTGMLHDFAFDNKEPV